MTISRRMASVFFMFLDMMDLSVLASVNAACITIDACCKHAHRLHKDHKEVEAHSTLHTHVPKVPELDQATWCHLFVQLYKIWHLPEITRLVMIQQAMHEGKVKRTCVSAVHWN